MQYTRYLTQYLLEMKSLPAETKVDIVCRHHDGYWNAVSADQFGEQAAIKIGKGALKGMTLSPELVSEWIDAFPITVHVSDRMEYIYTQMIHLTKRQKQHTEELKHRRALDAHDRGLVVAEMEKYPHPLADHRPHLYNSVTGQIAPDLVNVAESITIGEQMASKYRVSSRGVP